MGRKKTIDKLSEVYAVNAFVEAPFLDWQLCRVSNFISMLVLGAMTLYFISALDMVDKLFTFAISGKVIGTDYVLKFSDICWISAAIVATLLAKSIYNYLKIAKNRNKIKLQIKEATPFALTVRVSA